ncbi:MAG: glycosyltransferase family 4 protein [Candidatus Omnitrophica bacterium]|nr:glycosyltransferase family 4 protein [Candidatus Omnitrophota bacterium]
MRINILSSIDKRPSAVNRQLLEYGNYLYLKGHTISIIKAINRGLSDSKRKNFERKLREIGYLITGRRIRRLKKIPWAEIKCPTYIIPSIKGEYLKDADITFFSFEYYLPIVEKLPEKYGKKVMRVCNIFFAERVSFISDNIYLISVSTMIKKILEEKIKREVFLLVNSINTKIFNNPLNREKPEIIGMFFYNRKPIHKGIEEGFWVMEQLKRKYPYLKFQVCGEWKEGYIPDFVKFIDGRYIENLINFYRTTDIFIFTGKKDACPNPPMEAMACKCAVVTTNVGGILDYAIPNQTAIVVEPMDKEGILKGVISLIENNGFFRKISNEGYNYIQNFSVEKQGKKLEDYFLSILK